MVSGVAPGPAIRRTGSPGRMYKSAKMSAICRDHKHRIYPISFHDNVRCMLCEVNDINPEDLGVHYHHPLTGQTDWSRDYGE